LAARIPLGVSADRIGRQKPFIVMGCALTAISGIGFLVWYTPSGFLFLRGAAGLASASWVSFTVLYASYFTPNEGPRRISQLNIYNQLGRLLCYMSVGAAVAYFGLHASFVLGALVGTLSFMLSFFIREKPRPAAAVSLKSFTQVARDRNMMVTSLLGLLTQVIAFSTYYGFSNNLALRLRATGMQLSVLNLVLVSAAIVANLFATSWLPRYMKIRHIVAAGFLSAAVYCVLAPLSTGMMQLYLCQVLAGIASGFTFAMLLGHCVRDIASELRSAGMGFYQAVYGIGMTIGPIVMGIMIDAVGLDLSFYTMAAVSAVTMVLTLRLMEA
jgi:MFS family permease